MRVWAGGGDPDDRIAIGPDDLIQFVAVVSPMYKDTQKAVATGQHLSPSVALEDNKQRLLASGGETFSRSETATVRISADVQESAPCRDRTYDPVIKSHLLYQLS
jgi:hypothetical protein